MPTYPPPPATLVGDQITASRFLNSPTLVHRKVTELASRQFITDRLLVDVQAIEGGSLLYETSSVQFTNDPPKAVAPGATYPRTTSDDPTAATATPTNWGLEEAITDATLKRRGMKGVQEVLQRIVNTVVRQVDTVALTALSSGVSQGVNQIAAWGANGAQEVYDVANGLSTINDSDAGFEADVLAVSWAMHAHLLAKGRVTVAGNRDESVVLDSTGSRVVEVCGLQVLPTSYMPSGINRLVADSRFLGGFGFEDLDSPEWQGSSRDGIETRVRRDPSGADQWLVAGRRSVVPFIQEASAACIIGTGF